MKRFALLLALLLAACGNEPEDPKPSAGVPGGACPSQISEGKKISFGPGNTLAGVVLGDGKRGAVLTHELNANLCQWVPAAKELLARGFRVLLFDVNGFGASPRAERSAAQDVAEGVKVLRDLGSETILLMGDAVFTTAATQLHEASKASKDARLHIITGGSGHGVSLVSPGGDEGARNALASFLKTHIEG